MTQNTEYLPKKDTDDVNEDEDVDAKCPPSEDDDKPAKKGKKEKTSFMPKQWRRA